MSMIVKQPLTGPATWRGADLAGVTDWLHVLSADELDELDRALAHVRDAGRTPPRLTRDDFPLPTLSSRLQAYADELENGRGFAVLRGLPVDRYPDTDLAEDAERPHLGAGVSRPQRVPDPGARLSLSAAGAAGRTAC
ncbi:hypothetical protein CGZ93_07120 [Enemella dayhoffiae]|uniref:TauD/TfdA-like domain-containing protein n=1 Tax=Enemella dayhoffiae TaxID=2016507 RepID=A0A255H5A7_9ACTN|nr:hypothetical protein [Enemella dayhoffiae]OYO22807.1 hypothetical protein CGZ93_07120 [Enemella dayhoffiae]